MWSQLAVLFFFVLVGEFVWGKPKSHPPKCNQNVDFNAEFNNFTQKFNRNYTDVKEQQYRFGVFVQNYLNMQKYQSQAGDGVQFGVTRFMDWTLDEKKALVPLNLNSKAAKNGNFRAPQPKSNRVKRQTLPTSFDWSAQGKVSPVKNQGSCGCCWAFAATGVLESQYAIYRNVTFVDFSEQEIVDCETVGVYGSDYGCDGGLPISALYYTTLYGDSTEAAYPYTQVQGTCSQPINGGRNSIDYCFYVYGYDEDGYPVAEFDEVESAETLTEIGPLAHHIYVPESFYYYVSGVYHPSADECANNIGGHAITAVGYGVDAASGNPYWLLKNQWGTDWGMNGYFMLYRGDGTCSMGIPMAGATWYPPTTQAPKQVTTTTTTTTTTAGSTTPPPPLNGTCPVDTLFIIDSSDGITSAGYTSIITGIVNTINQLNITIGAQSTQIAVVTAGSLSPNFAPTPYLVFNLLGNVGSGADGSQQAYTTAGATNYLQTFGYTGGQLSIATAFNITLNGEFTGDTNPFGYVFGNPIFGQDLGKNPFGPSPTGDRLNAPNYIIVITGPDNTNVAPFRDQAIAQGIDIFAIGLNGATTSQLDGIAGNSANEFTTTTGAVATVLNSIFATQICSGNSTTAASTTTTATTLKLTTTTPTTTTTKATSTPPNATTTTTPSAASTLAPLNSSCPVDLLFIIDSSDTMTQARYTQITTALSNTLNQANIVIGASSTQISIVLAGSLGAQLAPTPYMFVNLLGKIGSGDTGAQTAYSTADLQNTIQTFNYMGGQVNIALAFNESLNGEFDGYDPTWYVFGNPIFGQDTGKDPFGAAPTGDRPNAPNYIVVITGSDTSNVTPWRNQAISQGITVFAVGVEGSTPSQLDGIAGNANREFSTTVAQLDSVLTNLLTSQICPANVTQPTTTTTPVPATTAATAPTTPPAPLNGTCLVDVLFIIDSSDAITAAGYASITTAISNAISQQNIVIGAQSTQIAVVTAASMSPNLAPTPYKVFNLRGYAGSGADGSQQAYSTAGAINYLQTFNYMGGQLSIATAFNISLYGEFTGLTNPFGYLFGNPIFGQDAGKNPVGPDPTGDRTNAPNYIIVITGPDSTNVAPLRDQAIAQGISIFAIGLNGANSSQLDGIAGNANREFSTTTAQLSTVLNNILQNQICSSPSNPTTQQPGTPASPLPYCCANRDALIIQNSPNSSVLVQNFFSAYTSKGTISTYPFKWGPTIWNQWAAILNTNIVPIIGNTSLTNAQKHEQIYDLSVNFINVKLASNKSYALCVPESGFGYFGDYLQCQVNTGVSAAPSFSLKCADWFSTSISTWSLPSYPC